MDVLGRGDEAMNADLHALRIAATRAALSALFVLMAHATTVFALDPTLDISQYAHASWKIQDGFTKGPIRSIAQTPDGYLWLGTEFGLFRFDGVRNVPWPATNQPLPSNMIFSLLVARDGTLWIGTDKGLASWNGGRLTQFPRFAGKWVFSLLQDREGVVWVGTVSTPTGGELCAIQPGRVECYGEDGALGQGVFDLYEDKKGDLGPGNYRFRVMASNNSGVWNETGAFLDFSIAPVYYQTAWFMALCVAVFLALLAALYQLKRRQLLRQFNIRLEERVRERTRIARDLHDTLLQSFQGVLLRFHTVTYLLPDRPQEAHHELETVIEQAREAITEGRDAVKELRSPVANDLGGAIDTLGEELAAGRSGPNRPDFSVHVEGTPRLLAPLTGDETYRIAVEAVRNSFQHARASRIEVDLEYGPRKLLLRVRDDGKGMDPKAARKEGHYGLTGMHERAKAVGGDLEIWSKPDSGTEVELTIPASTAYAKPAVSNRWLPWRRGPDGI
jgi:signal transduction histidine kinase